LEPAQLGRAGGVDPGADGGGCLGRTVIGQLPVAHGRYLDLNVDAVEQRPGDPRAVALYVQRRAGALLLRIAEEATRTPLRCLFANPPKCAKT